MSMEVSYESDDDFQCNFLSDISGGGLFIGTHDPLEINSKLTVCFHVPGISDSLVIRGTVVWVRGVEGGFKPGMGVRFDEMKPEDRRRLDNYLAEQKKI